MILAYLELRRVIDDGVINALPENVNGSSIDVRLNNTFIFENPEDRGEKFGTQCIDKISLKPRQFCLASTIEVFNLPLNISAEFRLKSSIAREGLNHNLAVWIDAGFTNSVLTLELFNVLTYHSIELTAGMKIGQIIFHRHIDVPEVFSYRTAGQYNDCLSTQESKGIR